MAAGCGTTTAPSSTADLAKGERAFQKCFSCHALEPGAARLQGPTLHKVVGRRVAAEPDFSYSPALRAFADRHRQWTAELLDRYIADPEALVPATSMTFHGIRDPQERRALIDYLQHGGG